MRVCVRAVMCVRARCCFAAVCLAGAPSRSTRRLIVVVCLCGCCTAAVVAALRGELVVIEFPVDCDPGQVQLVVSTLLDVDIPNRPSFQFSGQVERAATAGAPSLSYVHSLVGGTPLLAGAVVSLVLWHFLQPSWRGVTLTGAAGIESVLVHCVRLPRAWVDAQHVLVLVPHLAR